MQLLKLTTTEDKTFYVNLESLVELHPKEEGTSLLVLSTHKFGTEVTEPIETILKLIKYTKSSRNTVLDPKIICPEAYV